MIGATGDRLDFEWQSLVHPGVHVSRRASPRSPASTTTMLAGRAAVRGHRGGACATARGPRVRRAQRALRLRLHPPRVRARSTRTGAAPSSAPCGCRARCIPEMPRHNLDAVMERHGITVEHRHRAMPDAQVLWQLWRKLRAAWPRGRIAARARSRVAARDAAGGVVAGPRRRPSGGAGRVPLLRRG